MRYLLLFMMLAVSAMAENPDVPNSALAIDAKIGDSFGDELHESRLSVNVLLPISDRLTMIAGMDRRDMTARDRYEGWKFDATSTRWEIGCRWYIGKK